MVAIFFGVSPQDPIALVGATTLLVSAALAVLVTARRATAVDAAVVLPPS